MEKFIWRAAVVWLVWLTLPTFVRAQYVYTTANGQVTITQYTGTGGNVTIPDSTNGFPITTVASGAFFQVVGLTNVTFGTNVGIIAGDAIFQCVNITNVNLPASVTNIGSGPFLDCKSLVSIFVNTNNTHFTNVGVVLFDKALDTVVQFPGGLTNSYTLPATVTSVGESFIGNSLSNIMVNSANTVFTNLGVALVTKDFKQLWAYPGTARGSYSVPTNINFIISAAFEYSTGVTNIFIPTNTTSIGGLAFFDCANLQAITVAPTNSFFSSTNGVLFDKGYKMLIQYPCAATGSYAVPNTCTNIEVGAFGDAVFLSGVFMPNGVTNIDIQAFYGCTNLTVVIPGTNLISIGQQAFFLCTRLPGIVFPPAVKSLGQYAFGGCFSLTSACFEGSPPTDGGSVFLADNSLTSILHVSGATGWSGTYDGIFTAVCTACTNAEPILGIARKGTNALVEWSSAFPGFTLLSTTNLVAPVNWSAETAVPVTINNLNVVTNDGRLSKKFYKLQSP